MSGPFANITHRPSTRDDPDLPVLTFRFWVLGTGLAAFGAVLAEIYYWKVGLAKWPLLTLSLKEPQSVCYSS